MFEHSPMRKGGWGKGVVVRTDPICCELFYVCVWLLGGGGVIKIQKEKKKGGIGTFSACTWQEGGGHKSKK